MASHTPKLYLYHEFFPTPMVNSSRKAAATVYVKGRLIWILFRMFPIVSHHFGKLLRAKPLEVVPVPHSVSVCMAAVVLRDSTFTYEHVTLLFCPQSLNIYM
jgi:hypothetical protein